MSTLTWHVGSILPYASLWHTVNRAVWLNKLRTDEFAQMAGIDREKNAPLPRAFETMFAHSIDIRRLASILGERPSAFRGCSFDRLTSWEAERYVIPRIRWCPECIEHGYHSIFSSLRLLTKCPIHALALQDKCPVCHDTFPTWLQAAEFKRSALCSCGMTALLRPHTCRQSTLPAELARSWAPVEKWLRDAAGVFQAAQTRTVPSVEAMHLSLIPRWCEEFGIAYPACFERGEYFWPSDVAPPRWTMYRAKSVPLAQAPLAPLRDVRNPHGSFWVELRQRDLPSPHESFWVDSPETAVYRAMAKHVRRHGVRHSDRWMKELSGSYDAINFARKMRAREGAKAAFTEMIWARGLEPYVYLRRWPCRRAENQYGENRTGEDLSGADDDSPYRKIKPRNGNRKPWSQAVDVWIRSHGMGMAALAMWAEAHKRTRNALEHGWADWTSRGQNLVGNVFWFARVQNSQVQFVGYLRDLDPRPFRSLVRSKRERMSEAAQKDAGRTTEFLNACRGPCLTWSALDGWQVVNAFASDSGNARLLKLRQVDGRRKFWLFGSSGHFVARWTGGPVQAHGDSPSAAINALRVALKQYLKSHPDAPPPPPEGAASPGVYSEDFRVQVAQTLACLSSRLGAYAFWELTDRNVSFLKGWSTALGRDAQAPTGPEGQVF